MAELDLGAGLIPEPPGMTTLDPQARSAASPKIWAEVRTARAPETWELLQQVLWGLCLY